ncbi:hypothetical protein [Bacillus mycoides]|uniref:hypothetical protein n=1 Tax=Bacillus mycoides TaxID=1405 RepID=UPI001643569B|nr:hypothetical protein [Bacillus mycoides]
MRCKRGSAGGEGSGVGEKVGGSCRGGGGWMNWGVGVSGVRGMGGGMDFENVIK